MDSMCKKFDAEKEIFPDCENKDNVQVEPTLDMESENSVGEKNQQRRSDVAKIGSVVRSDEKNMGVLLMKDYEIVLTQKDVQHEDVGQEKAKCKDEFPAEEMSSEEETLTKKAKFEISVDNKELDDKTVAGDHESIMEVKETTALSEEHKKQESQLMILQESVNVLTNPCLDRTNSVSEGLESEAMEIDKNTDNLAKQKAEIKGEIKKPQEIVLQPLENSIGKNTQATGKEMKSPTIDSKQVMPAAENLVGPIKIVTSKPQPIQLKPQKTVSTVLQSQQQLVQSHPQYLQEGATTSTVIGSTKQIGKPAKIYSLQQIKMQQPNKVTQPIKILDQVHQPNQQINNKTLQQQQQQPSQKSFTNSVQGSAVKANATANSSQFPTHVIKSGDSLLNNNITKTKFKSPNEEESKWHTVGIFNGLTTAVSSYIDNSLWSSANIELTTDNLPDLSNFSRVPLEPGTAYRFRLRAINSVGVSEWGEVSSFKTCLPGFPGAPSAIKISKSVDGAHLTWEPPPTSRDNNEIVEYSVYLAVKPARDTKDGKSMIALSGRTPAQLAFLRVYVGPVNQCVVSQVSLLSAHVDCTNKPAIIFRIAARNEKGYGPATQVRWLQDAGMTTVTTNANSMNAAAGPRVKTEATMPVNTAFKRYKTGDVRYNGTLPTNNE